MKKILILTSGNISKLDGFKDKGVSLASFNDVCFDTTSLDLKLKSGQNLKDFDVIYFRFVGRSLEIATLIVDYAIKNRIQIVDRLYEKSLLLPSSQSKLSELRKLSEAGIKVPATYFGNYGKLTYPYVIKSTTGQKAKEVWLVKDENELKSLQERIDKKKIYFAQELVPNARRIRVLVVGQKIVGAVIRQTKWNKDETKETLSPVPQEVTYLALNSAKAADLDICGVDILVNSQTSEMFVIEANAAPSWKLINKYCGVVVEDEIIKYLQKAV